MKRQANASGFSAPAPWQSEGMGTNKLLGREVFGMSRPKRAEKHQRKRKAYIWAVLSYLCPGASGEIDHEMHETQEKARGGGMLVLRGGALP